MQNYAFTDMLGRTCVLVDFELERGKKDNDHHLNNILEDLTIERDCS